MRGFAITLVAVSLIAILVVLSTSLRASHLSMERALVEPQSLVYASFMFETVGHDIHSIVGPDILFHPRNDSFGILILDVVPSENFSDDLSDYENFLEGTVANETHTSLDVNLSAITPEDFVVTINEDYTYAHENNDTAIFTSSGATGATSYQVNITVIETRANLSSFAFDPGGDLNVSLVYSDLNGTKIENGMVRSNGNDEFIVNYTNGGELRMEVGRVDGSDGGFSVEAEDVEASLRLFVMLPPLDGTEKMGYGYNATMEYLGEDVRVSRKTGE